MNYDKEIDELTSYIVQQHADIIYDDCTNIERNPLCECHAKVQELITQASEISGDTSDGYHTFNELYEYRMVYNALYVNELIKQNPHFANKSKKHSDGELCFGGGWFVVTMYLPTGQVTNHYELKDWDKFHCEELDTAPEWDGHSPKEALNRMLAQLQEENK